MPCCSRSAPRRVAGISDNVGVCVFRNDIAVVCLLNVVFFGSGKGSLS